MRPNAQAGKRTPERTCILTRRNGTRDELIRLALGPDGERRARRARPRARARRLDRRRPRRRSTRPTPRASSRRAAARVQDQRGRRSRRSRRADRGGAAPGRARPARHGGARRQSHQRRRARSRPPPARGKVHLLLHAADASEDGRRKLDQAWRVGRRTGAAGADFPRRAHYIVHWHLAAKMWYMSP